MDATNQITADCFNAITQLREVEGPGASPEAIHHRLCGYVEAARERARESGLAQMLQEINKNELRKRGTFEEYDTLVLLKWGTGYTRRHIWVEVNGNTIRFRLTSHRVCPNPVPLCDGEYHTFTSQMWANSELLRLELYKYYRKPVAESSDD